MDFNHRQEVKKYQSKSNTFIGFEVFKLFHEKQMEKFDYYVQRGDFEKVYDSHFDWWIFPVNLGSMYRNLFRIDEKIVCELKKDKNFMKQYIRGHEIVSQCWGWDLSNACKIKNPKTGQKWSKWPVRLWKAGISAFLFGQKEIFLSWVKFALRLQNMNSKFVICTIYENCGHYNIITHEKYGWVHLESFAEEYDLIHMKGSLSSILNEKEIVDITEKKKVDEKSEDWC